MNALFNIPYGLYILTAKTHKYNGCIINTLMQVTSTPERVSITVNKDNYTTKMIEETGEFTVSVLDTTANFDIIKRFGFSSGANVDKFKDFHDFDIPKNGIPYISKHTNSYFCAKVVEKLDVGTHIIFVADIKVMAILSLNKSLTYDYYKSNIKPEAEFVNNTYVCSVCGYVHKSDNLPEDFVCPICKHGADVFELQKNLNIKKYVCPTCGYTEESKDKIETCIICGAKMQEQ